MTRFIHLALLFTAASAAVMNDRPNLVHRALSPARRAELEKEVRSLTTTIADDTDQATNLRAIIKEKKKKDPEDAVSYQRRLSVIKKRLIAETEQLKEDETMLQLEKRATTSRRTSTKTTTRHRTTTTRPRTTTKPTTTKTVAKTSTTTARPTATSAPGKSSKKGLGYNTASYTHNFSLAWAYDWANNPSGSLNPGVEFCPMLWGTDSSGFTAAAKTAIASGSTHLLGFNEPDLSSQSNMTPAQAAAEWKAVLEPLRTGNVKLVSPAITNGAYTSSGAPMGVNWMAQFIGNCTGCHIDAIAAHWYDSATNIGYFTNYFTSMSQQFGKPIWITEFAGSGTVAQQQQFFQTVIPWMENQSFIERYAAFGDFAGTFVNQDGSLTPLGASYNSIN